MHVEISRMITGWLGHAEFGVNALIGSVPRLNLAGKADRKPGAVKIYNDVEGTVELTVHGIEPPTFPCLVVVSDLGIQTVDVVQEKRAANSYPAVVGIGYYAEEAEDKAMVIRDGNYVLRAVMRSINRYKESPERSREYRVLNDVKITSLTRMTEERVAGAVPTTRLLGMVFVDLLVLDMAP